MIYSQLFARIKLVSLLLLLISCTGALFAQTAGDNARISVNIISALAIPTITDLNFGNIAVGTFTGSVLLSPEGNRTVTGTCQISGASPGTVTAASLAITGQGSYTYGITLPSHAIALAGTGTPMSMDTYISNPSNTGLLTSGTQTLKVGGTLHVAGNQAEGTYSLPSGLNISVFYN